MRSPSLSRWPGVLCLLLAPAAVAAVFEIVAVRNGSVADPFGDHGTLELYTRVATEGRQMLGPYSRFCLQHPGPLYFYASVPLYVLCGGNYLGVKLTALLINALAVACMLRFAAAGAGAVALRATAIALGAFLVARQPGFWLAPWNPNVVVLPFGAALFSLAKVASGSGRGLLPAALAVSFVVQTHVGTLPAMTSSVLLTLGIHAIPVLRRLAGLPPRLAKDPARVFLSAALLFATLWILPLWEQFESGGGNLARLFAFGMNKRGQHDWREVIGTIAQGVSSYRVAEAARPGPDATSLAPFALVAAVSAGLFGSHLIARRFRDSFTGALSLLCLVGLALALLAAKRVPGTLFPYLVGWTAMFGVAAVVVTAKSLHLLIDGSPEAHRRVRLIAGPLAAGVLVLLSVWSLFLVATTRSGSGPREMRQSRSLRALAVRVEQRLNATGVHRPMLVVDRSASRPVAIGFLLALDKRGLHAAVRRFACLDLRGHFSPDGTEDGRLILKGKKDMEPANADERVVSRGSGLIVYLAP